MTTNKKSSVKSKLMHSISEVVIKGEGFDEFGKRYFKFAISGSNKDIAPFPAAKIVKESTALFATLVEAGWNGFTPEARSELLERLEKRKHEDPRFKVATRLGWNSGAYVLPDQIVGEPKRPLEKALGGLDGAMLDKYRTSGSMGDWRQQIATLCSGNSRLMFSVSAAFTGPILPLVAGPKAGGFQVWGDSESGKTTAAMVAGSVWGCHREEARRQKGFAESWNSTEGKVEVTALAHNNTLLILDETKRAGNNDYTRARVVTSVAFGLAEMTEKERLTNPGSARSWHCYFLSTSNYSFAKLGQLGKIAIDEAELGRMVDIPLPKSGYGIYESLHDFANGEDLSNKLQQRCRKYYGTPAREFISKVLEDRSTDLRKLTEFLKAKRAAYRKALAHAVKAENLTKPLGRSSDRFATVFAAGALACKYGIVPWRPKQLREAILKCQLDQLRQPDQQADAPETSRESLRAKLVRHLNDHRKEFMYLNERRPQFGADKIDSVPGYRDKNKGHRWYYLTAQQLTAIIGNGAPADALKQTLVNEGLMDSMHLGFDCSNYFFQSDSSSGSGENHGQDEVACQLRSRWRFSSAIHLHECFPSDPKRNRPLESNICRPKHVPRTLRLDEDVFINFRKDHCGKLLVRQ